MKNKWIAILVALAVASASCAEDRRRSAEGFEEAEDLCSSIDAPESFFFVSIQRESSQCGNDDPVDIEIDIRADMYIIEHSEFHDGCYDIFKTYTLTGHGSVSIDIIELTRLEDGATRSRQSSFDVDTSDGSVILLHNQVKNEWEIVRCQPV